ncbi:malate dehydrogenase, cytoplasmic-like isoform X2 [Leucoraja erinacea]|uniref:malate dehydrogenase, cytoplasmic-like isoform X2 n=1 Tax=Leucoraja erinaceus TaxID=7782 RepID=UPI00245846FD|nr:malate dehydrogenase, cytoplasmic-like isoform X2 [Leucoraja erinacea]
MAEPVKVAVTRAAGPTAYSLLYSIANGEVCGNQQPVALALLDSSSMLGVLSGVAMELQDCAFQLLQGVTVTDRDEVGFVGADIAVLLDAVPAAQDGAEPSDLWKANVRRFRAHGRALDTYAKKSVKVLVAGNSANTNCLVAMISAPSIPAENFTCLTRRDRDRDRDQAFLYWEAPVIRAGARTFPNSASVARATCDHLCAWWSGTKQAGRWHIIPGLVLPPLLRQNMALCARELLRERDRALASLVNSHL